MILALALAMFALVLILYSFLFLDPRQHTSSSRRLSQPSKGNQSKPERRSGKGDPYRALCGGSGREPRLPRWASDFLLSCILFFFQQREGCLPSSQDTVERIEVLGPLAAASWGGPKPPCDALFCLRLQKTRGEVNL